MGGVNLFLVQGVREFGIRVGETFLNVVTNVRAIADARIGEIIGDILFPGK